MESPLESGIGIPIGIPIVISNRISGSLKGVLAMSETRFESLNGYELQLTRPCSTYSKYPPLGAVDREFVE